MTIPELDAAIAHMHERIQKLEEANRIIGTDLGELRQQLGVQPQSPLMQQPGCENSLAAGGLNQIRRY